MQPKSLAAAEQPWLTDSFAPDDRRSQHSAFEKPEARQTGRTSDSGARTGGDKDNKDKGNKDGENQRAKLMRMGN